MITELAYYVLSIAAIAVLGVVVLAFRDSRAEARARSKENHPAGKGR